MSDKCNDLSSNITKLSFPGENLGFTTEIDGRENKEDFLNFPFDHMYACNSDNSDLNSDRQAGESEVRHLKDLLLLHLDLIQQQSDEIVNKDKYIAQLRQENEMLKQRLERMDRRVALQQNNKNTLLLHNNSNNNFTLDSFSDDMTHDNDFCTETDSKDTLKTMGLCTDEVEYKPVILNIDRQSIEMDSGGDSLGTSEACFSSRKSEPDISPSVDLVTFKGDIIKSEPINLDTASTPHPYPDSTTAAHSGHIHVPNTYNTHKETRQFALRPNIRRKRICSTSSQMSISEALSSATDERRKSDSIKRSKVTGSIKRSNILTTDTPYITQAGTFTSHSDENSEPVDLNGSTNLEVPRWRVKVYSSCYSMEGTENLDDDVYNRRHMRLENDERRRKRWDVQRIREQRHIERLKQRQERSGVRSDDQTSEPVASFWPSVEDIRFIEVTDELPVSAFGTLIPKLPPSEFRLPWLNGTSTKKPNTRKSTAKRKTQKR